MKLKKSQMGPLIIILIVELFIVFFMLVPFIKHNNLLGHDMAGHYFDSWFTKEYLFPKMIGWNPFFYGGFPNHQFYPPMYAYLTSVLAFIFSLEIAFKLVLAAALLMTPISFYYCARCFGFSRLKSAVITVILFAILFLPMAYLTGGFTIGATLDSTFGVGLVTNALALPIFFFYLGGLNRFFRNGRFIIISLLMAGIILTHVFMAIAASLAFISYALIYIKEKKHLLFSIKHIGLSFLLTAFWVIPFLAKSQYASFVYIYLTVGLFFTLFIIIGLMAVGILIKKGKDKELLPLISFFFLSLVFILLGNLINIPFHVYRLMLLVYLLTPFFVIKLINKKVFLYLFLILGAGIIFFYFDTIPLLGPEDFTTPAIDYGEGRNYILNYQGYQPSFHTLQTIITKENERPSSLGLYVESAYNGRSFQEFGELIDSNQFEWGIALGWTTIRYLSDAEKKELIKKRANLLHINHLITHLDELPVEFISKKTLFPYNRYSSYYQLYLDEGYVKVSIPTTNLKEYFYLDKDRALFINLADTGLNYSVYSIQNFSDGKKLAFKTDDETFFVRKTIDGLHAIDFKTNESIYDFSFFDLNVSNTTKRRFNKTMKDFNNSPELMLDYHSKGFVPYSRLLRKYNPLTVNYYLYQISNSSLIEVLDYVPERITENWKNAVDDWFLDPEKEMILVKSETELPELRGTGDETVEILENSRNRLKFRVGSDGEVPIFIKISYFPNWKAYVNGKKTNVYDASPHFMLIYGEGEIELRYEYVFWDKIGIGLSIIGIIFVLFGGIYYLKKKEIR